MKDKTIASLKSFTSTKMFTTLLALILILLFNLILKPDFFVITIQDGHLFGQLIDVLNRAVPVMILSMGMTLVIATGGTDLSVGAVMALAGAISIALIRGDSVMLNSDTATPLILVLVITLVLSCLCGLWNGFLVSKLGMQPVVATLILMVAGRGAAQLITGARNLTTSYAPFSVFGQGWFLGLPVALYIAVLVFFVVWFFTRRTAFGLYVESVGVNASASRYAGLKASLIVVVIYAISGLCAGISGIIYASNIMCADATNAGMNYELDAIISVVLGGTSMSGGKFQLGGSIIGAIILMALTKSIYAFNVAPEYVLVVKALVVVVVVLIQSPPIRQFVATNFKSKNKGALTNE